MSAKQITLALQGGGSHGAFTWGVLERLMEDERIDIEGISGASAGAINAAILAHGYTVGGREGARRALTQFWQGIATKAAYDLMPGGWPAPDAISVQNPSPAVRGFALLAQFFSPYQLNPLNFNPLRDVLAAHIDFERVRADCKIKLFVAATHVATGRLKIFTTRDLTLEVLLASACIPSLHHSVEIQGEAYWDGGLTANPPLRPLLYHCNARDILMVLLHPVGRPDVPATADEITHRLTEISFGSALYGELQGIALAKREAESAPFSLGRLDRKLRRLNLHSIDSQDFMGRLGVMSKLNTQSAFIEALREEGRDRADDWLEENFSLIGARSSFALSEHL